MFIIMEMSGKRIWNIWLNFYGKGVEFKFFIGIFLYIFFVIIYKWIFIKWKFFVILLKNDFDKILYNFFKVFFIF